MGRFRKVNAEATDRWRHLDLKQRWFVFRDSLFASNQLRRQGRGFRHSYGGIGRWQRDACGCIKWHADLKPGTTRGVGRRIHGQSGGWIIVA
jgi:hypothetical protein